ncbi:MULTISPECIES: sensor histidine kinase [unclassified Lentimonas]|uniref:sensor histidine kinase n=1 Tax=unclassified Lentimonas TaxID=2630993 RepID=UPI00132A9DF9|nr:MULTISPECIES: histidine kinase [unclassified Lentimonas]CAA6677772.1 Unannotated [Lentimonas sp. CC4]CAA6685037.1 Unannotated [Lentimonas sp. CC6]CAA7077846.1 Unannotated [Lentimonas sp. CC4]CAA7169774.1 Unannotated [Lentimonas sp. CC21]CAA7179892.1 Unannotated [Lentimonas sp. CC8]
MFPYRLQLALITFCTGLCCATQAQEPQIDLKTRSISQLEQQLNDINSELKGLAHLSLRSGIGNVGYRSMQQVADDHPEWVEIQLNAEYPIDQVVLVPTIWRDTEAGFQADGFPLEFQIRAGTEADKTGKVIAKYSEADGLLPRIAPVIVATDDTTASWLRIESFKHSRWKHYPEPKYTLQFSEVLIFSGTKNVALHQTVHTSSNMTDSAGAWDERFLVDGFVPYLMDSALGSQSLAYVSSIGQRPTLTLDLERPYPINQIHLHAVDQSDTVPQVYAGDLGIPPHLRVEGAMQPNFSDAVTILDYQRESINNTGPILMWNVPETTCRYVRIVSLGADRKTEFSPDKFRIGYAEVALFSGGHNVAFGKAFQAEGTQIPPSSARLISSLTDGNNLYGQILPIRTWMEELARRHDLETLKPLIEQALAQRYARQKSQLRMVSGLAALLAAAIGLIILIQRNARQRQLAELKERMAADLHDELGANLHTIRLFGDLAKESVDSRSELLELLDRSSDFTERSIQAVRKSLGALESKDLHLQLVDDMRDISSRILTDQSHTITFEGEAMLQHLKPRKQVDLFLFYKECLTNIVRHSGATRVTTQVIANRKSIQIIVTDNGHSLPDSLQNPPASLARRAKLIGAHLTVANTETGTHITLILPLRKWNLLK